MTDVAFEYDKVLLKECALQQNNACCKELWKQHQLHYNQREAADESSLENTQERFNKFVKSVVLVHEHNSNPNNGHEITLNQFADALDHELPLFDLPLHDLHQELLEDENQLLVTQLNNVESILDVAASTHGSHRYLKKTIVLKDKKRHDKHHHNKHNKKKEKLEISLDDVDMSNQWAGLEIVTKKDWKGHQIALKSTDSSSREPVGRVDVDAKPKSEMNVVSDVGAEDNPDEFATHLNWATANNPDGVPLVHAATDQGKCGSCWAFAATGTLEASASRRAAYHAFNDQLASLSRRTTPKRSKKKANTDGGTLMLSDEQRFDMAVATAQEAEQSAIQIADLSVQELVDCDTAVDEGCTGGNPLLAFYFIHRYGLASSKNYPYDGDQLTCRVRKVANPIATVSEWGLLTSDHEDNMELVLRHIGPIAVGVNGSDPSFLAYKGGIYDADERHCEQMANHALLITGYGQEQADDGTTIKYWIARNSWGRGYGEGGYVRVKRGPGGKNMPGVCGIARNPSVALGGRLLSSSGYKSPKDYFGSDPHRVKAEREGEKNIPLFLRYCDQLGLGDKHACRNMERTMDNHRFLFFSLFSLFIVSVLVVWPLSGECRARRRRQKMRQLHEASLNASNGQDDNFNDAIPSEVTVLLNDQQEPDEDYGSSMSL